MTILLDTQLLLWWQAEPEAVPSWVEQTLRDSSEAPVFSVISIWEIAIKSALGRPDFAYDATLVRTNFLDNGWSELALTGPHVLLVPHLGLHHGDPFDRALAAQAKSEHMSLVTTDKTLGKYGDWVKVVKRRQGV